MHTHAETSCTPVSGLLFLGLRTVSALERVADTFCCVHHTSRKTIESSLVLWYAYSLQYSVLTACHFTHCGLGALSHPNPSAEHWSPIGANAARRIQHRIRATHFTNWTEWESQEQYFYSKSRKFLLLQRKPNLTYPAAQRHAQDCSGTHMMFYVR